jgi:hypothetical protein
VGPFSPAACDHQFASGTRAPRTGAGAGAAVWHQAGPHASISPAAINTVFVDFIVPPPITLCSGHLSLLAAQQFSLAHSFIWLSGPDLLSSKRLAGKLGKLGFWSQKIDYIERGSTADTYNKHYNPAREKFFGTLDR